MIRVYLDTQIYSYLKKQEYSEIKHKLLESKRFLQFFYSQAHIEDLKQDSSNEKFVDLEFIHEFAETDFLIFDLFKQYCDIKIVKPIEAFNGSGAIPPNSSFELNDTNIESLIALRDVPEFQQFSILFNSIEKLRDINNQNPKGNIRPSFPYKPTPEQIAEIKELGFEDREYTWSEWEELTKDWSNRFQNDDKMYRRVRQISKNTLGVNINRESVPIEKKNEMLRDTPVGKTFLECLELTLAPLKQVSFFDNNFMQVILAYSLLNIFGLDAEKSRKVRLSSIQKDAMHVYYAMHTDFLVSCDKGMIEKATFLYNLFGIKTKVVHLDDFVKELTILDGDFSDIDAFEKSLTYELSNGLMFDIITDIESGNKSHRIKLSKKFFSYFDELEVHTSADNELATRYILIFYRCKKATGDFVTYKEIECITNKLHSLFGMEDELRQEFSEVDYNEVRSSTWSGRKWTLGNTILKLEFNYSHNLLILMYLRTD